MCCGTRHERDIRLNEYVYSGVHPGTEPRFFRFTRVKKELGAWGSVRLAGREMMRRSRTM